MATFIQETDDPSDRSPVHKSLLAHVYTLYIFFFSRARLIDLLIEYIELVFNEKYIKGLWKTYVFRI